MARVTLTSRGAVLAALKRLHDDYRDGHVVTAHVEIGPYMVENEDLARISITRRVGWEKNEEAEEDTDPGWGGPKESSE